MPARAVFPLPMDALDVVLPTFLILLFNTNLFINSQGVTYGVNLEEQKKKKKETPPFKSPAHTHGFASIRKALENCLRETILT